MPKTKKKSNKAEVVTPKRSSNRVFVSVKSPVVWLFPEECKICSKTRIKSTGKVETPDKLATLVAERQLKNLQNKRILSFTPKLLMLT